MSSGMESEEITSSHESALEDAVDSGEQSLYEYNEFEELSYGLSEEDYYEFSVDSIFTDTSIKSYESPERLKKEIIPADPLIEVPPKDYPDMLFLMGNDFPKAIHAYEHVRSLIKWKSVNPKREIHILAPRGDYKNGIFFFSICQATFNGSAYCHEKTDKSMMEVALTTSRYVPAKDQYDLCRLTCLNPHTFEAITTIFKKEPWCTSTDVIMWLPWYCAREVQVNLPNDGVEIQPLGLEHIDLIHESWQEHFPGCREILTDMIDIHEGLGLFQQDSLLSWALVWYHGGIGIIQTIEKEKGKGYSRPVVEALTKRMGECLIDVHLKITRGRKRDIVFFSALGFRYAFKSLSLEHKKCNEDEKLETKTNKGNPKKQEIKSHGN